MAASLAAVAALSTVLAGFVPGRRPRCPAGMAMIEGTYCVDLYEGSLVEVLSRTRTRPWSPFVTPTPGLRARAQSRRGVTPQGYISQVQARAACAAAGKRLCTEPEWTRACKGPAPSEWPYGPAQVSGRCNDNEDNRNHSEFWFN